MSAATVVATRSELLARRARASFAEQGRSLLADKRQALVAEFAARTQALLPRVAALQRDLTAAREALERAEAHTDTLLDAHLPPTPVPGRKDPQ